MKGASWDTISCNSVISNQKIRCLTIKNTNNTDYVFLGGNGIYLYKKTVNNVQHHNTNLNLTIYPNPAKDQLYIKTDKAISNIRIYNAYGREVLVEPNEENIINLCGLSSGLYIMTLTIDNVEITRKFIKEEE